MIRVRVAAVLAACLFVAGSAYAGDKNDPYAMPANVKAIMEKMGKGQVPTPAEQKAMMDWSNKMSGGHAVLGKDTSGDGDQQQIASDDDDDARTDRQIAADMCRKDGHAPGLGQRVSKDAYLAMATAMKEKYRNKLDSNTATLLFQTLEKQHWSTIGGQFAGPLMARNSWDAAIVSAATGAERAPDDAMTANNLGSALKGLKDYGHAAIAFNYARTLKPDSAIVASNLGSLATALHDTGTARRFYFAALSKAKNMSVPNAELGLQSLCGNKLNMAMKYFRASLKGGYTTMAADGLYSTERYIQKDNPGADIGQPSDDSSGNSSNPVNPYLPQPPIAGNIREVVGFNRGSKPDKKWTETWTAAMEAQGHEADALVGSSHPQAETTVSGNTVVFRRGYEKEMFFLGDLNNIFAHKFETANDRARKDYEGLLARVNAVEETDDNCSTTRANAMSAYPAYVILAKSEWPELARVWSDKFKAMSPLLGKIHDDSLRQQLLDRQFVLAYDDEAGFAQQQGLAQGYTYLALQLGGKCGDLPAFDNSVPGGGPKKNLKKYPDPCKIHEAMNFGIASFKGDCDKMVLEFNIELVSGSVNVNWGKDASQDQITIFGGVGGSLSTGDGSEMGSVGAAAKFGDYVTFKGGEMVDGGLIGSFTGGVQAGPASATSEDSVKYSTVGNNDFGGMKNGVVTSGTVFNQSNTFAIQPPSLPEM